MAIKDQDPEKDFLDIDLDDALGAADDVAASAAPESKIKKPEGPGVLIYDDKKYAVGLKWLVADEDGDVELAVKRAKGFKADFYCMRQNVVVQHGFAFLSMGHRVGLPVLASVVGDVLVGEWHGVFVADNGWWYLAVHADNIAPDGDLFFTSEEQAYNHFIARMEAHRWPRSYAPESWNIQETTGEIPLSKIIGEAPAPALKPVTLDAIFSGRRNKNLAIAAGVVVVALLGVSLLGQQLLPSLIPTPAQLPVPNVAVSDTLQAPPKEPINEEGGAGDSLTSIALVQPSAFVGMCLDGFSHISVPLPGWTISKLRCKETFVEGTWARVLGTFEMIEPYLNRFPKEVSSNFIDRTSLIATRRLTGKPPNVSADFLDQNTATLALNKRLANLGDFDTKYIEPAASKELLAGVDMMQQAGFNSIAQNKPNLRPLSRDDLPYVSLTLKSRTPPNMIAPYFDMAGLVILSIEGELQSGYWLYEAKVILKPDKRLMEANNKAKAMQIR
ncbi:MAG: type 4b pilus protein PilO2 [Alphaproteobacteria bacterium]|nr:type 4b pilus protein PilO2 [Alphaproteobacteria bacterium]